MCSSHLAHLTGSIDAIRSLLLEKASAFSSGFPGANTGGGLDYPKSTQMDQKCLFLAAEGFWKWVCQEVPKCVLEAAKSCQNSSPSNRLDRQQGRCGSSETCHSFAETLVCGCETEGGSETSAKSLHPCLLYDLACTWCWHVYAECVSTRTFTCLYSYLMYTYLYVDADSIAHTVCICIYIYTVHYTYYKIPYTHVTWKPRKPTEASLVGAKHLTDHTFPVTDTFSAISNTLFALSIWCMKRLNFYR